MLIITIVIVNHFIILATLDRLSIFRRIGHVKNINHCASFGYNNFIAHNNAPLLIICVNIRLLVVRLESQPIHQMKPHREHQHHERIKPSKLHKATTETCQLLKTFSLRHLSKRCFNTISRGLNICSFHYQALGAHLAEDINKIILIFCD